MVPYISLVFSPFCIFLLYIRHYRQTKRHETSIPGIGETRSNVLLSLVLSPGSLNKHFKGIIQNGKTLKKPRTRGIFAI